MLMLSSELPVQFRVSQGSMLGPFVFLVGTCINDLPFYLKDICDILLFADDIFLILKVVKNIQAFDDVHSAVSIVQ